jgi:hypothetical protein
MFVAVRSALMVPAKLVVKDPGACSANWPPRKEPEAASWLEELSRVKTTGLAETLVKQRLVTSQRKQDVDRVKPLMPLVNNIERQAYHIITHQANENASGCGAIADQRVISVVFALPRSRAVGTFNSNARIFP